MNLESKTSISNAALLILTFNLIGRVLGLVREIVYASNFGLSANYDVYLVASIIPLTITSVFFYIIQNYFIPTYNKVKANDKHLVNTFISKVFVLFLFQSILITILLLLLKNKILHLYLGPDLENFDLINKVFYIFIFTIPVSVLFSILSAYLQAEFEFKSPAIAQIFSNLFIILFVALFNIQFGIYSIVLGYFLGTIFQLFFLYIIVKKKFDFKIKYFESSSNLFDGISSSLFYIIIIESVSQLYLLSDRYFFRIVETGGIAALNYSTNIYSLPIAIITVTMATAIFPSLSELFVSKNFKEIFHKITRFINVNILFFMPITFIFYFWGESIIKLILERGNFYSADTTLTYSTLKFYSLGLIPFSIYAGFNKLFYSFGWIKKLLWVTSVAMAIKITLNYFLVSVLKQNGLALATSISYTILFLITGYLLWKDQKVLRLFNIIYFFLNYLMCAIISYITIKLFVNNFISTSNLLYSLIEIILFLMLYLFTLNIYKDKEFVKILDYTSSLINKFFKNLN